MANPGYPMQPMQQQPMQMQQAPQQPRPVRRGTSKAVPVVISAGLAIGVFCGLSFGLGFGEESTTAEASTTTSAPKPKDDGDVPEPFQPKQNTGKPAETNVTKPAETGVTKPPDGGSGSAVAAKPADAGSGSAGSGSAATVPTKIVGKLQIVVKPDAAAKAAKIFVDGKQIEDTTFELDLTELLDKAKNEARKNVTVTVKAAGYKDKEGKVDIVGAPNTETRTSFEVELSKKPSGGGGGGGLPRPPNPGGNGKPKCKKPPCGLIDI